MVPATPVKPEVAPELPLDPLAPLEPIVDPLAPPDPADPADPLDPLDPLDPASPVPAAFPPHEIPSAAETTATTHRITCRLTIVSLRAFCALDGASRGYMHSSTPSRHEGARFV
jgi:hypothetical protein